MNYLHEYKTFNSIQELNYHVKQHTNRKYYDMNETQRNVLQTIAQYSVKYIGASHLKVQTIANAVGKSSRTVERAIKALSDLRIIEKVNTLRRVKGGQGANIYRILPYNVEGETSERKESEDATPVKDETDNADKETANLLSYSSNTYKDTERRDNRNDSKPTTDEVIKRGLKNAIPETIYNALSPFFDGQALYDSYGILLRAKSAIDRSITLEEYGSRYVDTFYNVVRLYKTGKVRKSLRGLLYTAWERLSAEISRQKASVLLSL